MGAPATLIHIGPSATPHGHMHKGMSSTNKSELKATHGASACKGTWAPKGGGSTTAAFPTHAHFHLHPVWENSMAGVASDYAKRLST